MLMITLQLLSLFSLKKLKPKLSKQKMKMMVFNLLIVLNSFSFTSSSEFGPIRWLISFVIWTGAHEQKMCIVKECSDSDGFHFPVVVYIAEKGESINQNDLLLLTDEKVTRFFAGWCMTNWYLRIALVIV